MAVLRKKDVRKLGVKELNDKLSEIKLELAKERANVAIGATVTSPGKIKELKRAVARIKTELASKTAEEEAKGTE